MSLTRAQKEARLKQSRKRQVKRAARKREHAKTRDKVLATFKAGKTFANIMMVRGKEEVVLGQRTGLFGHPTTTVLRLPDEKIVGAVEDVKELGEIVTQLGILALAALVNYNPAFGPEGLAKALARWANIDLTELEKRAEEEALAQAKAAIEAAKAEGEAPSDVQGYTTDEEGDLVPVTAEAMDAVPGP